MVVRRLLAFAAAPLVAIAGCGLATGGTGLDSSLSGPPVGAGGASVGASGGAGASGASSNGGKGGASAGGTSAGFPSSGGASAAAGGATMGKGGSPAQGGAATAGKGGAPMGQGGGPVGQGGAAAQGGGPVGQGGGGPIGMGGAPAGQGGAAMGPVGQGGAPIGQGGAPVGGPGGPGPGGAPAGPGGSGGSGLTGPCQTMPGACVQSLPAGWALAAFEENRNDPCPALYETHDVVASPTAMAGACSCKCAFGSPQPTCTKGQLATFFGGNNKCDQTGLVLDVNGSGCTSLGGSGNLDNVFSATPLPATQLTCSVSTAPNPAKVLSVGQRLCAAPAACAEDVCNGVVDAGFKACIYRDGDVSCPAGWNTRTLVGDDTSLACSQCVGCVATASCTAEKIKFFSDGQCKTQIANLDATGACVASNGMNVSAFEYTATITNATCAPSNASTATVDLKAPRTVCCK